MEPVYFSKIEFQEGLLLTYPKRIISLNLVEQELGFQVLRWKKHGTVIEKNRVEEQSGKLHSYRTGCPALFMSNEKTDFQSQLMTYEDDEPEVLFSYGKKLSKAQMHNLLPYCNANDFEPFRNLEVTPEDLGWLCYRDTMRMQFIGVTDSHIPIMTLPMIFHCCEEQESPSERLYNYIVKNFFAHNFELKKWLESI